MNIERIKEIVFTTKKEKEFFQGVEELELFRASQLLGTPFWHNPSVITEECAKFAQLIFFSRLGAIKWVLISVLIFVAALIFCLIQTRYSVGLSFVFAGSVTLLYALILMPYSYNNHREGFLRRKSLTKTLFDKLSNQEALADEQIEKFSMLQAKYANPSRVDIIDAFPEDRDFLGQLNDHPVNLYWNHKKSRYLKNLADEKEGWQKYKLCLDKERALVMSL
jgi:hypothetical protein